MLKKEAQIIIGSIFLMENTSAKFHSSSKNLIFLTINGKHLFQFQQKDNFLYLVQIDGNVKLLGKFRTLRKTKVLKFEKVPDFWEILFKEI